MLKRPFIWVSETKKVEFIYDEPRDTTCVSSILRLYVCRFYIYAHTCMCLLTLLRTHTYNTAEQITGVKFKQEEQPAKGEGMMGVEVIHVNGSGFHKC